MALTLEQIKAAEDREIRIVEVPEWGGQVLLRSLSAAQRDAYETSVFDGEKRNLDNMRARLVAMCMCDDNGDPISANGELAVVLGAKRGAVVDRLFDIARKMSGMSDSDVKDLEGN